MPWHTATPAVLPPQLHLQAIAAQTNASYKTRHVAPEDERHTRSFGSSKTASKACHQPCSSDSCPQVIASVRLSTGQKHGAAVWQQTRQKLHVRVETPSSKVRGRARVTATPLSPSRGKGVWPTPTAHTIARPSALPWRRNCAYILCCRTGIVCRPTCKGAKA